MRYIEKLANAPWLADQEHVEFLHGLYLKYLDRIASGQPLDTEAIEQELGRPLDNTRAVSVRDGVARIPVIGTIVQRANMFTAISGGVSSQALALDLTAARNDPAVRSILLVFDSPGGEAHGVNELAGAIRDIRDSGAKPIEAYVDGDCASAAYWLASATSRITTDATAAVGSIGVVTRIRNPEAAGDRNQILEFWNARSPRKRIDPASEAGRAAIQEYVDDMGDEFIAAVAENRGVSEEKVVSDFGQGFVLTGRKAVEAGLADALGSEEEVVKRLQRREAVVDTRGSFGSDSAVQIGTHNGAPVLLDSDDSAKGLLARIGALISGSGIAVPGDSQANASEPGGNSVKLEDRDGTAVLVADSGEELELSADDRQRLTSEETEALRAENERLTAERDEYARQVEALKAQGEQAAAEALNTRVERELDTFAQSGVPKYMLDLARPALAGNSSEEAERWRSALSGFTGSVEYGERGSSGGKGQGEMTDDEKIRAELAERELGMESYGAVAGELVAAGEIRSINGTNEQGGE